MVNLKILEELEINIEDMPNNDMKLVAESCGIEVAVMLLQYLSGIQLNIPKFGFKKIIDRYILENYDGHNAQDLAMKLDVSQRYVYKILKGNNKKKNEQLKFEY